MFGIGVIEHHLQSVFMENRTKQGSHASSTHDQDFRLVHFFGSGKLKFNPTKNPEIGGDL